MKGIVLAGGRGTRLYPATRTISKHMLMVYDKPLIYYPLSVLMLAGIRDILVISTPRDLPSFQALLGDGSDWGIRLAYRAQPEPDGIAEALIIGRDFVGDDAVVLILGDNIFYGSGFVPMLRRCLARTVGATVLCHPVRDPERYGVIEVDSAFRPLAIAEKPAQPRSNLAVTGLYFYDSAVFDIVAQLRPSARGELEISDVNSAYLERGLLHAENFGRGFAWFDAGTADSLLDAANFVATIERRQSLKVACLEEIAWRNRWIGDQDVLRLADGVRATDYGAYLRTLIERDPR